MIERNFKRAYIWELPVRIFHWSNALCVLVLIATGFLIANPPAIMSAREAHDAYWFGTVRFVHFVAAYVFFFMIIFRTYWAFVGNRHSSWRAYVPFTRKAIRNILHVLRVDIFLLPDRQSPRESLSVGHNSLAAFSYLGLFFLSLIMVFTGFGLYSATSEWWLPDLFNWVVPMLGGDQAARIIHHAVMWLIILFVMIHVYLVLFHDWVEGRGSMTAMLSGYKYVCAERVDGCETEEEEKESEPAAVE